MFIGTDLIIFSTYSSNNAILLLALDLQTGIAHATTPIFDQGKEIKGYWLQSTGMKNKDAQNCYN